MAKPRQSNEDQGSFSQAKIPTGSDLNWRVVYPGQWTCDNAGYIWSDSLKGGRTHLADVRGWGYLTGGGSGALDLPSADAERIQDEVGALICVAPDLLAALEEAERVMWMMHGDDFGPLVRSRAAIAKATRQTGAS